ncbi:hypothetical protein V6N11_036552 [Hibiscus sabdariffa]|uniref:Uncharacterized protein n=1 Tax=Hibiscus sabdariffa TaxID=183260 RepID=A0ABR2RAS6_9ROSI
MVFIGVERFWKDNQRNTSCAIRSGSDQGSACAIAPAHGQENEEFEGHDEGHGHNEVLETVGANSPMHDVNVHGSASTPEICRESIPMISQQHTAQSADTLNGISPEHSNDISSHGDMNSDSNMPIPIPAALKSV